MQIYQKLFISFPSIINTDNVWMKVEMPLYMECLETAMNLCRVQDTGGPLHVKLVLEWDMPAKTQAGSIIFIN